MEALPIVGIEVTRQMLPLYYGLAIMLGVCALGTILSAIRHPALKVSFTRGIDLFYRPLRR